MRAFALPALPKLVLGRWHGPQGLDGVGKTVIQFRFCLDDLSSNRSLTIDQVIQVGACVDWQDLPSNIDVSNSVKAVKF